MSDRATKTTLSVVEHIEINPPQPEPALPERKTYLCRHIFVDGRQCGSRALRNQNFCYYHQTHRTPVLANTRRRQPQSGFDLTRLDGLDNHAAIQLSLAEVLGKIADNSIDPKRAGLLLYGLDIAGRNLKYARSTPEARVPMNIVEDGVLGQLAEVEQGRTVPDDHMTTMRKRLQQHPNSDLTLLLDSGETKDQT